MNLGDLIKKALREESAEQKVTGASNETSGQANPNRKKWDAYAQKAKLSGAMHNVAHETLEPIPSGFVKNMPLDPPRHTAFLYGRYHDEKEVWLWATSSKSMQKWKLKKHAKCTSPNDHLVFVEKATCKFILLKEIQQYIANSPVDFDNKWNECCLPFPEKKIHIAAHSRFFDCVKNKCKDLGVVNEFTYRGHVDRDTHEKILSSVRLSRRGN